MLLDHPAFALPETIEEALAARAGRPDAAYVAGGTELLPDMLWRTAAPGGLVSLSRVAELRGIEERDDGRLLLGAGLPIARLLAPDLAARVPALAAAAASLATPIVRNQATLGGNVMSALPYRNLLPALVALDASVSWCNPADATGMRFRHFVTAPGETRCAPGELLYQVSVPVDLPGDYVKVGPRNAQFVATASGALILDTRRRRARFGFGNAGPVPLALDDADTIATAAVDWDTGTLGDPAALAALEEAVRDGTDPPSDHVASADYRRHALGVVARRLLVRLTGGEA